MKRIPFSLLLTASAFLLAACGPSDKYPNSSVVPSSTETEAVYYTITFDSQGGSEVAPLQVKNGEKATAPADPTFGAKTFTGWYVEPDCITYFDWERVTITADWTLYAGWEGEELPSTSDTSSEDPDPSTSDTGDKGNIKTVYFRDPAWWCADGAITSIHYWNSAGVGTSWPGLVCTLVGERNVDPSGKELGGNLWSFELDLELASGGFMFARHNPDASSTGSTADWGAKTPDLSIAMMGDNNLYDASASPIIWGDPGVEGVWGDC